MKPIPRFPGDTYLVTRRTNEGIFRLLPKKKVNQICLFCLLYAAQRFNIELHAFCFMSNHFHLVITDPDLKISPFMQWLDLIICRCLNAHYHRQGILWAPGKFHAAKLCDDTTILEKIVYTITNPVKAALVKKPQHWPGVISLSRHYMGAPLCARRPRVYFGKNSKVPPAVSLQLTVPKAFSHMSMVAFRQLLNQHLKARCEDLHAEIISQGRKFLGPEKVLEVSPEYRPSNPFIDSEIIPLIACKDRELRKQHLRDYKVFFTEHRRCREAFRRGEREVRFPAGTNWWRQHVGVLCEPIPPPELRG